MIPNIITKSFFAFIKFNAMQYQYQYQYITGKPNQSKLLYSKVYQPYGYPWFKHYSEEQIINGSNKLSKVDSIVILEVKKNHKIYADNTSFTPPIPHIIGKKNS